MLLLLLQLWACARGLGSSRQNIAARDSLDRAALKTCAGIRGEDLFYVSFTNGYASTLGTTVSG